MDKYISIVDDEEDIVELVSLHLKKNYYKTLEFYSAKSFFASLKERIPDLVILDLMLPDMDGIDICKQLKSDRKYKNIPIIMLTAKQDEIDRIIGLEIGADDYVTKPFSPRELVARVKAVLRRPNIDNNDVENKSILNIDGLIYIDLLKYEVYDNKNNKIFLTIKEFNLLKTFIQKRGWVFSREKLLNKIWGEVIVIDRTIDVHINHLRKKLGKVGELIKNVRGIGYKLDNEK